STIDLQVLDTPAASGETFQTDNISIRRITTGPDHAPVVSTPVEVSGGENGVITVNVTASDPDGDAITSLSADLTGLPAGNHAVFTPGSGNTTGTLSWTPMASETGTFSVSFRAANALSGSASISITVAGVEG